MRDVVLTDRGAKPIGRIPKPSGDGFLFVSDR